MQTTNKVQTGNSTTGTSTTTTSSQWQTYNHYQAEKGWECPRCGHINAPWVRQCDCSNNWNCPTITWTCPGKGSHDDWWKTYVTCGQADANTYTTAWNTTVGGSDYWNSEKKEWTNVNKPSSNKE